MLSLPPLVCHSVDTLHHCFVYNLALNSTSFLFSVQYILPSYSSLHITFEFFFAAITFFFDPKIKLVFCRIIFSVFLSKGIIFLIVIISTFVFRLISGDHALFINFFICL